MTWEGLTPPYRTIVADPPWPYGNKGGDGFVIPKPEGEWNDRGVESTGYSLMGMDELHAMPVRDLADDDAHLYLWTTNGFMVEAHDLCRSWGFKPKTVLTWTKMKNRKDGRGITVDIEDEVSKGVGYWFRGATEHVVFGVRGSLRLRCDETLPTGFLWPRIARHSVKPPQFFDLAEKASPGPRVELFARQQRLGWDSWGFGYEQSEALASPSVTGT